MSSALARKQQVAESADLGSVLVGRQPIFDAEKRVAAYELLYRHPTERPSEADPERATSAVLINAVTHFGLDRVVGSHPAYINFAEGALLRSVPAMLPPDRIVVEVLESVRATPAVRSALRSLAEQGYRIALDDFEIRDETRGLMPLANVIKIDVLRVQPEDVAALAAPFSELPVTLLAEKVETEAMFDACADAGFELFQGFWLEKPAIVSGQRLDPQRHTVLQLLAALAKEDAAFDRVGEIVAHDPALSCQLLRLVQSAGLRRGVPIRSVQHAVTMLGLIEMERWALLWAATSVAGRPSELCRMALTRSRLCERLSEVTGVGLPETAATVGLFASLDLLLGIELADAVDALGLAPRVRGAIVGHTGAEGLLLHTVLAHERGNWREISPDIDPALLMREWVDALDWAAERSSAVTSRGSR